MRRACSALVVLALFGSAAVFTQSTDDPPLDPRTRLVDAEGLEQVKAHCIRCHTPRLISQSRADRDGWIGMIRWMQETQELEELEPSVEKAILDYLERWYGAQRRAVRRAQLPEELLPPPADR